MSTGKSFSIPIDLDIVAKGMRYSKEFGAFVKETYGDLPYARGTLPYRRSHYKEVLSGFRQWSQLAHADEWLLFPENIGPRLAIDESSLSNGDPFFLFHIAKLYAYPH